MGFSVNTNNNAMAALRTLNFTNRDLSQVQERINSGLRVNGARDNASMFTIAQGIRGDIGGLKAVSDAIAFGQSTVGMAVSSATQISNKLNQIKQKVIDGASANVDKTAIQRDIVSLRSQIDAIASAASFNGVNLLKAGPDNLTVTSSLNRTSSTTVTTSSITVSGVDSTTAATGLNIAGIDVVAAANDGIKFDVDVSAATEYTDQDYLIMTVGGVNHFFVVADSGTGVTADLNTSGSDQVHVIDADLTGGELVNTTNGKLIDAMRNAGFTVETDDDGSFTVTHANGAVTADDTNLTAAVVVANNAPGAANNLNLVETAINSIKSTLGAFGTAANQLQSQADFVKELTDTLTEGLGTIVDADLAEESARLQALQTKQQLGLQALSIANQGPGAVLSLFR